MVLREEVRVSGAESAIFQRFTAEIVSRVPHLDSGNEGPTVINESPIVDITDDLVECARAEYGLDLNQTSPRIYGKLESSILGGSIKVRPAVKIIEDAILSGRLRQQTTVFEATSGNFGIALGLMRRLGLSVVVLVSRRLQDGVLQELRNAGVKAIDLDIDICPTPGIDLNPAKRVSGIFASSVRNQLAAHGFDVTIFDRSREEAEDLLAREDAIGLAKLLARIYDGFCPEQYDNQLNLRAHETLTGPEIEQQLRAFGSSLAEFDLVCAFGTGGTSGGLSRYVQNEFGRKSVHVVFPLDNQDVAGIRVRQKALGLRFYQPENYAGQHEVDFEEAKRALRFFVDKGYDIGESSALALYATLQMVKQGIGNKFVVILADGIQKYRKGVVANHANSGPEATLATVISSAEEFQGALWTHPVFKPSELGIELMASSLGWAKGRIGVATSVDLARLYNNDMPESIRGFLPRDGRKLLLVCMNGGTSLRLAQLLSERGVAAVSLAGGMAGLPSTSGRPTSELVQLAD